MGPEDLASVIKAPSQAPRSRSHTDPAIQRALNIIAQAINPIEVVTPQQMHDIYRTRGVERGPALEAQKAKEVNAFRAPWDATHADDPRLFVNAGGQNYRDVSKGPDPLKDLLMAASLVHEQIHETDRGEVGERAARRVEADFIESKLPSLPGDAQRRAREYIDRINQMFK